MKQNELDRHVARITGESMATIKQRGFTTLRAMPNEPDRRPLTIEWVDVDRERLRSLPV